MINIRLPNITAPTEKEQLMQVKSYLHQLVGELNWALSSIESGNSSTAATGNPVTQDDLKTSFNELKALIIKSSGGTDAVPKSYVDPADVILSKNLNALGWYKIGTVSGDMCAVVTLTIGGIFMNNQASPSMVDIATQYNNARAFLRFPSLSDNQISKIGVIKESTKVYGVYAYYNTATENPVKVNIHTHMGEFAPAGWVASSVTESDMLAVITLKQ